MYPHKKKKKDSFYNLRTKNKLFNSLKIKKINFLKFRNENKLLVKVKN